MTFKRRQKILNLAKELTKICDEHNIWYSITDATLLGAARHGGFVPWIERFQINILPGGLRRLKQLCPSNIIDSSKDKKYNKLTAAYVPTINTWSETKVFVELQILVPTTTEKMRRLNNPLSYFWNKITFKRLDIKYAIDMLQDNSRFEGYLELNNFFQKLGYNWHQTFSFETVELKMNGISFKAPREYDTILKAKYGDDYMENIDIPFFWYEAINPIKKVKVA